MTTLEIFNQFFEDFKTSSIWHAMENTHENSPWHREYSVAVHTQMLIDWYQQNIISINPCIYNRNEKQQMLTLVACLGHDFGKPRAEVVKFSEARGEYRAYHGHELLSARIWTDFALSNRELLDRLRLSLVDVSNIALMIEHHVPFSIKDPKKRAALKTAFLRRVGHSGHMAWLDLLECDQNGRLSDNKDHRLQEFSAWMAAWQLI